MSHATDRFLEDRVGADQWARSQRGFRSLTEARGGSVNTSFSTTHAYRGAEAHRLGPAIQRHRLRPHTMRRLLTPSLATTLVLAPACTTLTPSPETTARCSREIVELHQFFQDWFAGTLPDTDDAFARFAAVLHPDFHIVGTSGRVLDRAAILALVRDGHARSAGAEPPFVIEVRNVKWRSAVDGGYVLTYEEWQGRGKADAGRTSTVLLRPTSTGPNGLQWMHVHETELGET